MATIDDFGDTAEPLNNPVLGGPAGWAAAVRDALVALQDGLPLKVSKAGDTMTGALTLPGDPTTGLQAATKGYVDPAFLHATIANGALAVGSWQRLWANEPDVNTRPDLMSVVSGMVRLEPGVYSVTGTLTLSGAAGTAPRPAALVRAALWDSAGTAMTQALTVIALAGVVSGPATFPITAVFRVTAQSYFGPGIYTWDDMALVADSNEYPTDISIARLGS